MFGLFGALRLYENLYNNNSYTVIKSLRNIPTYLLRGKKILEQLSRPRFFPAFEISRSFLCAKQVGKRARNFKTRKNRGLASCSNIFFPLKVCILFHSAPCYGKVYYPFTIFIFILVKQCQRKYELSYYLLNNKMYSFIAEYVGYWITSQTSQ